MIRIRYGVFLGLLFLASPSSVWAVTGMVVDTDAFPVTTTNWSDFLTIDKFDGGLGTLCEVKLTLNGSVTGSAKYESLDGALATISLDLAATLKLQRPDLSFLVDVVPLANIVEGAAAFDGIIDFDGDSGSTFADLMGSAMDMVVLTSPADLALFTGPGTISLPIMATGASAGSGAGNLITQFATAAGADVKVVYTYKNEVPEPATVMLIGLASIGSLLVRRRS